MGGAPSTQTGETRRRVAEDAGDPLEGLGERLAAQRRRVEEGLGEARAGTHAAGRELAQASRVQLERSPYWTLGAAFGLGWVLGGGLPAKTFTLAAGIGGRMLLSALVQDVLRPESPESDADG